ncbi:unnamed protein product [Clonostachys solani]|uniref:Metallo-beta-lactamase domain-containing protein n=1 Tax=Clonostachys solani TaxID=160281 RepID=A0A9N9Z1G5_9HYPO|nr:unnamed protein product [Clonostachys solani]
MALNGEPAPNLEIPPSQHVVNVSVIDSTANVRCPWGFFVKNPLPGHETLECPSFVFLVQHPSGKRVLFDLGLRKDIEGFPPVIQQGMKGMHMEAEKDIAQILKDSGKLSLDEIDAIIWSHWHADHTGDPSTFPSSTDLVVGPGFKKAILPGYPANPHGVILESDYSGRELQEVDFSDSIQIGEFRAFDYFNDGSFYLLDSPGHAVGHMSALARTTPSTFILMGGDGCHHSGSLRPSKHFPLPDEVSPSPFSVPPHSHGTVCPGAILEAIHPLRTRTQPYYGLLTEAQGRDVPAAEATIHKMISFDANDNVFVVTAHDRSLIDVIDFYPNSAND